MLSKQEYRRALATRHPFWDMLSPAVVKQRIDQLLTAPDCEALVHALPPVEYAVLLKEAPEMRPQLLQLGQPQQIRTVLDIDCWNKDTLQSPRVLAWLEDLQRSGVESFVRTVRELDIELLLAFLRNHIRVQGALPSEEDAEPQQYNETLTNELYRVEFLLPEDTLNTRIQQLLQFTRLADLDLYYVLMQGVMSEQESELHEWAYRWKSGRLQDEGFLDYYDALETYRLVDLEQVTPATLDPLQAPGVPESAEETGLVPSYAWSLTPSGSFLDRALANDFPLETLERLCWEMVYLCNRELVYDQVDYGEASAVQSSLRRVHAYVNVGLEHLSGSHATQLPLILVRHPLQFIYQVGFTLVMRLFQRAHRLRHHLAHTIGIRRALPSLAHCVCEGLLQHSPQFFEGLAQPEAQGYRGFLHLQDIALVDPILQHLETDPTYRLDG